jgi:predicted ABC-type ATPase
MAQPRLWLLAGPNGAGKTTYARRIFAHEIAQVRFLNADDIARDLAPEDVGGAALEAARNLLARRRKMMAARQSFVIETTLATMTLLRFVHEIRRCGYLVRLTYLYVSDPDICIGRIAHRVVRGGHFVASDVVRRRYGRSLELLPRYLSAADEAEIFIADSDPELVLRKAESGVMVLEAHIWRRIAAG